MIDENHNEIEKIKHGENSSIYMGDGDYVIIYRINDQLILFEQPSLSNEERYIDTYM